MMRQTEKNNRLTICALLIAIMVILTQFLSIPTPIIRIGFNFVPLALAGMLFGPVWSTAVAGIADLLGAILFPTGGAYFPGFTITAILTGFVYGIFLYRREGGIFTGKELSIRIVGAVLVITLILQLGLNTFWISVMIDKGYLALLPPRILKQAIMIPVQFIALHMIANFAQQLYKRGVVKT